MEERVLQWQHCRQPPVGVEQSRKLTWVAGPPEDDHEQGDHDRDGLADELQPQLQPPVDALRRSDVESDPL